MEWKNKLTRTPYLVLFVVLIAIGVGTASAMITITLAGNVVITDDLTVDTDTLAVDSSENKVGIGTTSPTEPLDVKGNVAIDGSLDVSNAPIYSHRAPGGASSNLVIERIGGPTADNVQFTLSQRPTNKDLWLFGFDGTTFKNFVGFDYPNYKINFPVNGDALVIDGANDKVGIGTTNPSSKLHVEGDVKISGNFLYTENKTKTLFLPGIHFTPSSCCEALRAQDNLNDLKSSSTPGFQGVATVSILEIPDGAIITDFICFYRDNSATVDIDFECNLYSEDVGITTFPVIEASDSSSGQSSSYKEIHASSGLPYVFNSSKINFLEVVFDPTSSEDCAGSGCSFAGLKIIYDVSKVD